MTTANPKKYTTTYDLNTAKATVTFGAASNIDVTTAKDAGVYGSSGADWNITNLGSITGSPSVVLEGDATFLNGVGGKISNTSGVNTCIYIVEAGRVINAGSITGSGPSSTSGNGGARAVYLKGGGKIVNQATGTIQGHVSLGQTGAIKNAGIILNSGEHFSDVQLDNGGSVTNSGSIGLTGAHGSGIYLKNGGTVLNSGKIEGSAVYMSGIESASGGSITNTGKIKLDTSEHAVGIEMDSGGAVVNTGIISVTATTYHESGVELVDGGSLTNSGSIKTSASMHGNGVELENGGTVQNLMGGLISAGDRTGIYVGGATGVTITNAGTISGANASLFFANAGKSSARITNTLTLESGSDLIGQAVGSSGAFVANDLVFEGDGTASNVFVDFQSLMVDSAADWKISGAAGIAHSTVEGTLKVTKAGSLSGAVTIEGGTAIFKSNYDSDVTFDGAGKLELGNPYTGVISGLGALDEIDLLDLSFAKHDSASISGHVLTIESVSNQPLATLTLGNSTYSSSNFTVGEDAAGHVLVSYA